MSIWRKYAYGWVTLGFFLLSLAGYFILGLADGKGWLELWAGFFENIQSEMAQLLWQVGGLAFLLFLGSPQSKEGHDRIEAKIDEILRRVDPKGGDKISEIDELYLGRDTDARHHGYRR